MTSADNIFGCIFCAFVLSANTVYVEGVGGIRLPVSFTHW